MKNILKNFWTVLTRFKLVSALNLIGLSVAFATFTIIMMQVRWEYSYGKTDSQSDSLYRFDTFDQVQGLYNTTQEMSINKEFVESSPMIEDAVGVLFSRRNYKMVKEGAATQFFNDLNTVQTADKSLFSFFDIYLIRGSQYDFNHPGKAIISESVAKIIVGNADPVGKLLQNQWGDQYEICGVYKELPSNATIPNGIIIFEEFNNYRNNTLFVKIAKPEYCASILDNFTKMDKTIGRYKSSTIQTRLIPIGEIYFDKQTRQNSFVKTGNKSTTDILFFVGIMVVLIAMINFVNFYMALAPVRVKGLNTRLVFGSSRTALRLRIVSEAVGIAVIAFLVSILLVDVFNSTSLRSVMKIDSASITDNISTVVLCAFVALFVGVVAGLFPARYSTSFEPAMALKGGAMSTKKGQKLRSALVGFQYVISIVLIVFALFVGLQHKAMVDAPLGYDQENLFTVQMGGGDKAQQLCDKLTGEAFVEGIAKYNGAFGKYDGDMLGDVVSVSGDTIKLCSYMVSHNFLDVIGIPIVKGEGFKPDAADLWDDLDNNRPWDIVVNQKTIDLFGGEVGQLFKNTKQAGKILGVTGDFVSKSVAIAQDPVAFVVTKDGGHVLIRTTVGDLDAKIKKLNSIIASVEPENTPKLNFYSDQVAQLYDNEKKFGTLISLFSVIAIIISLVGVFGIVAFETQNRRKEIGVRKVFGSTVKQVLEMFNAKFLVLVVVSFVIAVPIAYWGVSQWLGGFVYKTPIYWWVFVVAGAVVCAITIFTVTIQSYRSAIENPVNSLKME